ncbi:hypothetical protein NG796_02565 [Laspinema sp. A4]|uniref:hypothetical protein n=1 Tax=Laspinema sp. D2d TaxID=2953686 RepID=UPI0021BB08E0|nr:hypothetical protein [Laspinema sp. D2d]MCT7982169.1 hypothetical protein [Laspinema sp. D2d]
MVISDLKYGEELTEEISPIEGGFASVGVGSSSWANGGDLALTYSYTATMAESSFSAGSLAFGIGYTFSVGYTLPSLPYPLAGATLW